MRYFYFAFILLALAYGPGLTAQAGKEAGLSVGLNGVRALDEKLSPLVYNGNSLAGEAFYHSRNSKVEQRVNVRFSMGGLESDVSGQVTENAHTAEMLLGDVEHFVRWKLPLGLPDKWEACLGYRWNFTAFRRNLTYLSTFKENNFEFMMGIGPALSIGFEPGEKHSLSYGLSFPLVSYVANRGYNPNFFTEDAIYNRNNLEWLGSFPDVQSRIDYRYALSPAFDLLGTYLFRFYRLSRFVDSTMAQHQLAVGLILKFERDDS